MRGILPRMRLSSDRVLTTHVGSLPRSPAVVDFLFKREQGEPYDSNAFDRVMAEAVSDAVQKQVQLGIDIVSDGETSKIGYATYIKDRLTGFDGDSPRQIALDCRTIRSFASAWPCSRAGRGSSVNRAWGRSSLSAASTSRRTSPIFVHRPSSTAPLKRS